jgi:uncharacterized protein
MTEAPELQGRAAQERSERPEIEQMRAAYRALADVDLEAAMPLIHPDVEVRDRPEAPDPQTYRGHDGVRKALLATFDTFEMVVFEPERFVEFGDHVVVVIRMRGQGKGSGVPVEDRIAHLWTLRDGMAWRLQVYSDPDEAIAAAQVLPPPPGD